MARSSLTGAPPVGALSVQCPVCRVQPGRPCVNSRGYLYEGSHGQRRALWLDAERQAARRSA